MTTPECPTTLPKGSWYGDGPNGLGWYTPDVPVCTGQGIAGELPSVPLLASNLTVRDPRAAPFVTPFDGVTHESLDTLHAHLKRFRLSRERYYHQYYPRKDPITGALIPFRDLDQYLSQDFADKNTLRRWLKDNPEKGLQWAKDWLARRKEEKALVYAPSQVELRTLCCPSMPYYQKTAAREGGYYGITTALGYSPRYTNETPSFTVLPQDAVIVQDTREQSPISLPRPTLKATVNVGDYALAAPYDQGVRIERKSLNDWCGTLSGRKVERKTKGRAKGKRPAPEAGTVEDSALERFDRELARAQEQGLYVVMMVEDSLAHAQAFDRLPHMRHVKASPQYLLRNLRDLLVKYPLTFQCVFVEGRIEMARAMMRVFELGAQVKRIDLQHAYEEGRL